jgi:hypothetical protein
MVEISMSGSGEGLGWATGPGYSTSHEWRSDKEYEETVSPDR